MGRTELMTWVAKSKRWTKKFRGKMYARSCRQLGTEPTKEASRKAANEWWRAKEEEIVAKEMATDPLNFALDVKRKMRNWFVAFGDHDAVEMMTAEIESLQREYKPGDYLDPFDGISDAGRLVWQDRFQNLESPKCDAEQTLASNVERFLTWKESHVDSGKISSVR